MELVQRKTTILAAMLWTITAACGARDSSSTPAASQAAKKSIDAPAAAAAGNGDLAVRTSLARKRVVLLGTSLTAGLGLDPDKAYPALLQQKIDSAGLPITLVNAGLSGETSAGALRRAGWVLDQPAAAVLLEVGANDGLRGVDPDSTKANLIALIKAIHAQQPRATVWLVQMEAPTNLGRGYTTKFHLAYTESAQETGTTLLPFLLDGVAGNARLNQADGIHPNVEGSKLVANSMWRALSPLLVELSR